MPFTLDVNFSGGRAGVCPVGLFLLGSCPVSLRPVALLHTRTLRIVVPNAAVTQHCCSFLFKQSWLWSCVWYQVQWACIQQPYSTHVYCRLWCQMQQSHSIIVPFFWSTPYSDHVYGRISRVRTNSDNMLTVQYYYRALLSKHSLFCTCVWYNKSWQNQVTVSILSGIITILGLSSSIPCSTHVYDGRCSDRTKHSLHIVRYYYHALLQAFLERKKVLEPVTEASHSLYTVQYYFWAFFSVHSLLYTCEEKVLEPVTEESHSLYTVQYYYQVLFSKHSLLYTCVWCE